jgi:hypothetical protein
LFGVGLALFDLNKDARQFSIRVRSGSRWIEFADRLEQR